MLAQAVEHLIKNIVDFPDDVSVKSHENPRGELIRVRVNPEDIGRVIGRSGRTANADAKAKAEAEAAATEEAPAEEPAAEAE